MLSERVLTKFLKGVTKKYLSLEHIGVSTLPDPRDGVSYYLYAHVPFCHVLCPYCSFNRFIYQEDKALSYFRQLRAEMRLVADMGYQFQSMYFGGGTPTICVDELLKTIDLAHDLFDIKEISCETNPNYLTPEFARRFEGRIQRLSVGVQSFNDKLLRQMCRYEKFGPGSGNLKRIKDFVGAFPALNVDMIFNIPQQTPDILMEDIGMVMESGASQISYYPLMTAPAVASAMNKTVGQVNYRREHAYYKQVYKALSTTYKLASAWTFSHKDFGMIDEYIVESEEYVGIGSGSFSYLKGGLYVNTFSLRQYAHQINSNRLSVTAMRQYGRHEQMRYRFMMELFGLRFDKKKFKRDFGVPVEVGLWYEMVYMQASGAFASNNADELTLSPRGRYLLVVMMREFFTSLNNVREEALQALEPDERSLVLNTRHWPVPL